MYMEQMKTSDSFSDIVNNAQQRITEHLDNELDAILSPSYEGATKGGGGAPPTIAGYFKDIYGHILPKYFSDGKVKPVVHTCLIKLASFVLLFEL